MSCQDIRLADNTKIVKNTRLYCCEELQYKLLVEANIIDITYEDYKERVKQLEFGFVGQIGPPASSNKKGRLPAEFRC